MKRSLSILPLGMLICGLFGFMPDDGVTWQMPLWLAIMLTAVGGLVFCRQALLAEPANG